MRRICFDLNEAAEMDMKRLQEKCDLSSRVDLLNNAFALFRWAVDKTVEGASIASIKDGVVKELEMPVFAATRVLAEIRKAEARKQNK